MPTRVAINGFGRIGRCVLRAAVERDADVEIVAVNDVASPDALAQLLEYDSVYGRLDADIRPTPDGFSVGERTIRAINEPQPAQLPWEELGVDVVLEATGRFRTRAAAAEHLEAGARRVVVSAPVKGAEPADADIVIGVNDDILDPERHVIVTNASCTTNCLAPVAMVLHEAIGIRHGLLTTVHAYTADQHLLDAPHKDARRARAAAINLIPTSTGAAKAVGLVLPALAGRLHGLAVRVPVPTGSLVDLTVEAERPTTAEEVNAAFAERAATSRLEGILSYSERPIVSADIVKSPYSAIFDAPLTTVVDGTSVKVIAWYDNEWGYANRLLELAQRIGAPVPAGV
jgi:glyceraldehyde 3-phosphate dehydrogenase (phosphorylating)